MAGLGSRRSFQGGALVLLLLGALSLVVLVGEMTGYSRCAVWWARYGCGVPWVDTLLVALGIASKVVLGGLALLLLWTLARRILG